MRLKSGSILLLILASFIFVTSAQAALEIDRGPVYGLLKKALPFKNLELAGYLKNETAVRLAHRFKDFMKEANIAQLEAEYKFSDHIQFFTILRFFYDAAYDIDSKYIKELKWEDKMRRKMAYPEKLQWLREIYLDILTDRLDLRLGKQQVVWGTADGVRILDVINPLDYREWTLKDYIDSRIPLFMINAEGKILLNGNLQLLLIPDYEPNYYPPAGAPFAVRSTRLGAEGVKALTESGVTVATIDDKPAIRFNNTKIGLRWRQILGGDAFEYTLNYYHGYDFASSAYTVMDYIGRRPVRFQLTRRAEQIDVFGGTFSKTITEGIIFPGLAKGWTLRGEFAYIKGGVMNYGLDKTLVESVPVRQYNYLFGFDKSFFTNWLVSLQFIQMISQPHGEFDKAKYTLLNGATRGPWDRIENMVTLKVSTDFLHEKLRPEVLLIYGDECDWRISPKVSFELNDQWLATAGFHFFRGDEQNLNGQFNKNSEFFTELKYTF